NQIRDGIQARLERDLAVDVAALNEPLRALFGTRGDEDAAQPDWQRIACALAARQAFAIITGGPGTGKTTTVVRLLAVLQGLAAAGGAPPLRIELAAPTGKAAARLNESIADQIRGLASPPGIADSLPTQVKTLHRLLGTLPNSRHFRHQAAHPLAADLVVVDEASMIDVEMMARLLDALRPDARLILLGDKDQLSSVEAGAVLGDLCRRAAAGHYRPETAAWLRQASGDRLPDALIDPAGTALDQSIVMLRQSYRFRADGGIGALAACVNETIPPPPDGRDRLTAVKRLFAHAPARPGHDPDSLQAVQLAGADDARFARLIEEVYGAPESYLRVIRDNAPDAGADPTEVSAWARRVLEAQRRFQLLTALRQGAWGVEGLNQRIIERLRAHGLLAADPHAEALPTGPQRHWFPGRPVMVTRNDYGLNLMNGDLGVTLPWPAPGRPDRAILRVAFPTVDGGVRWVLPSRLQSVETVFALTVHKSQGSEFDHAALILPDRPNPVLTRELLYTAITRAKHRFTLLYSEEQVLAEALEQRVQRASGLIGIAEAEPFEPLRDATGM
ncbi:exodeoxyribonuclease V subunit alpha, partial [Thioalkalicoccus limnaeus]